MRQPVLRDSHPTHVIFQPNHRLTMAVPSFCVLQGGDRVNMKAHPDAHLSQAQLEELARRLVSMRRDLSGSVETLTTQITSKDDCQIRDAADAASLQENRTRASSIANNYKATIAEIDAALDRLKNGRYGVSQDSGEPIAYERLFLIPWARTHAGE
jgi:DnaK suppressor protein